MCFGALPRGVSDTLGQPAISQPSAQPFGISEKRRIMDKIKPLYTATATATGGRNGHTQSSDGVVKADLSVPKEM